MGILASREFELFADYFQFYLQDERAGGDFSDAWNEETVSRMLAVVPGAVAVGTARKMQVPVLVEIYDREPLLDLEQWDRAVVCGLQVDSGRIVVMGCTEYFPDAARIEVDPGTYRLRVSYGSLEDVSGDGLTGNDHYRVQLWPGSPSEPHVLK